MVIVIGVILSLVKKNKQNKEIMTLVINLTKLQKTCQQNEHTFLPIYFLINTPITWKTSYLKSLFTDFQSAGASPEGYAKITIN